MRAYRFPVRLGDALLAAALVTAELTTMLPEVDRPPEVIGLIGAVTMLASLALRAPAPMVMSLVSSVGITLAAAATDTRESLWLLAAALVVAFTVGKDLRGARRIAAATSLLAAAYVLQFQVGQPVVETLVSPLVIVGIPILVGLVAGRARDQAVQLKELTHELERERDLHAQALVQAERGRIARELHDVVAHALSVMVVQAGALEGTLPRGSTQRDQVVRIRRVGRDALTETRHLLTAVRSPEDASAEVRPQPGVADIPGLVDQAGAALRVTGEEMPHPVGLGLAAYRIVQEGLTNVHRHAGPGARATVALDWSPNALEVRVDDDGRSRADATHTPGHGLVGMRERVAMYAGSVAAGPRANGDGWQVRAELPLTGETQ